MMSTTVLYGIGTTTIGAALRVTGYARRNKVEYIVPDLGDVFVKLNRRKVTTETMKTMV